MIRRNRGLGGRPGASHSHGGNRIHTVRPSSCESFLRVALCACAPSLRRSLCVCHAQPRKFDPPAHIHSQLFVLFVLIVADGVAALVLVSEQCPAAYIRAAATSILVFDVDTRVYSCARASNPPSALASTLYDRPVRRSIYSSTCQAVFELWLI